MTNWKTPALCILLVSSWNLFAQESFTHPLLADDWQIRIGGQHNDADVKIGLGNPELGNIPIVDLRAADTNSTVNSIWTNIVWQAPDRWSVGFSYFLAEVDTEKVTDSEIEFGDLVIPANSGLKSDFKTDFYILNGYYDFFQSDNRSAGIGLGIYALDLAASVVGVVDGQETSARESADVLAPLPVVTAYYKHAFNEKLAFQVNGAWLSANIDEYDGSVVAAEFSIEYWPSESWGFGAGFSYVDLDVTVDKPVFDQVYIVEYDSLFAFLTWGF